MTKKIESYKNINFPIGFFNGAAQMIQGRGGVWGVLIVRIRHYIIFWMGCGTSTNASPDFLAIWPLLYIGHDRHIIDLQVASDSKIIIVWENERINI